MSPYTPIAEELRKYGIVVPESSVRRLFHALCDLKGVSRPRFEKTIMKRVLRKYAVTGVLDLSDPITESKRTKAEYKPLKWPTCKEQSDYMRQRQQENLQRSLTNCNENWMAQLLKPRRVKEHWERQYRWGYRIYDFFSMKLGIAIEVDGPEHDKNYDTFRDVHNFLRSGVVVLRVRNKNEDDAQAVLRFVEVSSTRLERRRLIAPTSVARMELINLWKKSLFDGELLLNDTRRLGSVPLDIASYYRNKDDCPSRDRIKRVQSRYNSPE